MAENPVIGLSDSEIADFLTRHPIIHIEVSLGLVDPLGELVLDEESNGYVFVYQETGGSYRYLWSHTPAINYKSSVDLIIDGVKQGVKDIKKAGEKALDYSKYIIIGIITILILIVIIKIR
jgi:hypothetical protein